ncbi:MAG: AraC family ligand binding domain-containing protein, partial [Clostridiales bacterium]|nr:AraC family ligand binding domain-containing protein [Clostridiales bacterium]
MRKGKIINSWEVKPYICDSTYSSKMMLDDIVAGKKAINVNEGTLKGECKTPGGIHDEDEIYYIVKGEAVLHLGEETYDIKPGSLYLYRKVYFIRWITRVKQKTLFCLHCGKMQVIMKFII